jgi:hypothetical protein
MIARIKRTTRMSTGGFTANLPDHRTDPEPAEPDSFPGVIVAEPRQELPSRHTQTAEAEEAASALLQLAEPEADPEPEPEPETELAFTKPKRKRAPNKQPRQTKPRGQLKTKGGVSYCKPQGKTKNPGYWIASYKNYKRTGLATEEETKAKLKQWIDEDLCPCCEKPMDAEPAEEHTEYHDRAPEDMTEYRFKCSDQNAELVITINGNEMRLQGGQEYVIKI